MHDINQYIHTYKRGWTTVTLYNWQLLVSESTDYSSYLIDNGRDQDDMSRLQPLLSKPALTRVWIHSSPYNILNDADADGTCCDIIIARWSCFHYWRNGMVDLPSINWQFSHHFGTTDLFLIIFKGSCCVLLGALLSCPQFCMYFVNCTAFTAVSHCLGLVFYRQLLEQLSVALLSRPTVFFFSLSLIVTVILLARKWLIDWLKT